MKNISENTIKLFKSNYKLAISELEKRKQNGLMYM